MPTATVFRFIALATLCTVQARAQEQGVEHPGQGPQPTPSVPLRTPAEEEAAPTQRKEDRTWEMEDAHFILGAERLTNIGGRYYKAVRDGEKVGEASVSEVGFLHSGQDLPRLTFDYARLWTIGGTIGYRGNTNRVESAETPVPVIQLTKNRNLLLGVRGGALLAAGKRFSAWLRLGYEYQYDWVDSEGRLPTEEFETHSIVFDPRLVFAPVAHVGVSVGPYAQFDYGKDKSSQAGGLEPLSLIGFQGGLSLDLYAFIGR